MPPVRDKGRVCIRFGPRKGIASEQEERMLTEGRVAHVRTFDLRPCQEATLEDLAPSSSHCEDDFRNLAQQIAKRCDIQKGTD